MVVRQAEDEITAAQMVNGAMYMGTRALTATAGGGFHPMSETVSLNAIIENPIVLRPKAVAGKLVVDPGELKTLKVSDRYEPSAESGVSAQWLPGADAATYCAQADEHNSAGAVDETSRNTASQMAKRMRKRHQLKPELPEPRLLMSTGREDYPEYAAETGDIEFSSSAAAVPLTVEDVFRGEQLQGRRPACLLHLRLAAAHRETRRSRQASATRCAGGTNLQGQLGMLTRIECGVHISDKILKYDGRASNPTTCRRNESHRPSPAVPQLRQVQSALEQDVRCLEAVLGVSSRMHTALTDSTNHRCMEYRRRTGPTHS